MSFEEFVEGCSPRLFRTALLLAGQDRAMAEDLLQVALERAYRHWPRICRMDDRSGMCGGFWRTHRTTGGGWRPGGASGRCIQMIPPRSPRTRPLWSRSVTT